VNALANDKVGDYINENFVSSFLKVGTFTIAGNNKQGGNVATYFCLPDGSVLHAIAGPVDASTMLKEARWVVESRKLAMFESRGDANRFKNFFGRAHADRLSSDYGFHNTWKVAKGQTPMQVYRKPALPQVPQAQPAVARDAFPDPDDPIAMARVNALVVNQANNRGLDNRGKVHLLLANYPMAKVDQIYKYIFERVLNERISTLPVVQN
jgi:hypothetical protein